MKVFSALVTIAALLMLTLLQYITLLGTNNRNISLQYHNNNNYNVMIYFVMRDFVMRDFVMIDFAMIDFFNI